MLLYIARHAHAVDAEENPARPLSLRGIEEAERVARFLAASQQFSPVQFWHSSLVRARQTAEIFQRELKLDVALIETADLQPEDDPHEIAHRIHRLSGVPELCLFGHEPHLSALATLLVRGKTAPAGFDLKKGAVLALESSGEVHRKSREPRWHVCWQIYPALLARSTATGTPHA